MRFLSLILSFIFLFQPNIKDMNKDFDIFKYVLQKAVYENNEEKAKEKIAEFKEELNRQKEESVNILAVGDFMLHGPQLKAAKRGADYDFSEYFRYIKNDVEKADLALINLETTIAEEKDGYSGYPVFASPEQAVKNIKDAGFDIATTANNHMYDRREKGIENTCRALKKYGMDNIGSGKKDEYKPLIKEVNGIKIGFTAATYGINGFEENYRKNSEDYKISFIDDDEQKKDIEYLRSQKTDINIIFIHWGVEYQKRPNTDQEKIFEKLSRMGYDIVIGSHPHVYQKIDRKIIDGKEHYVIYSLGNFISNQRREVMGNRYSENEAMLNIKITKSPIAGTRVTEFEAQPLWVDKYTENKRNVYNVIPVNKALDGSISLDRINVIRDKLLQSQADFKNVFGQ